MERIYSPGRGGGGGVDRVMDDGHNGVISVSGSTVSSASVWLIVCGRLCNYVMTQLSYNTLTSVQH